MKMSEFSIQFMTGSKLCLLLILDLRKILSMLKNQWSILVLMKPSLHAIGLWPVVFDKSKIFSMLCQKSKISKHSRKSTISDEKEF